MSEIIDYRALLRKYMQHIEQCEGVTDVTPTCRQKHSDVSFTDAQWAELERINDSLHDDD